jgi:prolyl oligopeptidase
LLDVKFSGIAWKGDEGFYYSSYDKPKEGTVLSGMTDKHKVYFHKLGTKQSEDQLIFGGEKTPRRYLTADVSEDQRFLVISAANATNGNELYIKDLKTAVTLYRSTKDLTSMQILWIRKVTTFLYSQTKTPE